MLYLTRNLYTESDKPCVMYVVQVYQGRVESYYPFDCERQSMKLVNAILLSVDDSLDGCADVAAHFPPSQSLPAKAALYAYELVDGEEGISLKMLL